MLVNEKKLKEAAAKFLKTYPGGFAHPDMVAVGKKHKVEAMTSLTQHNFQKRCFADPEQIAEGMVQVVSRSSLVSMFEKPKFRDMVRGANAELKASLAADLKRMLHGNQERGFQGLVDSLAARKLGKWSLLTVIPNYFRPDEEVFIKPTTAKGVISHFELEGLVYRPQPSWEFYTAYREAILEMRAKVDPSLAPNNAAFCGFLMMSLA